jgi:phosphoribosylformylglycinamidine (FGAM) synthase-like amidotransferase family enzyme
MICSVLVITGDGINCERETARAFEGAQTKILHVNEFLKHPEILLDHQIFCIPGGFSFGDELRSGKILAEKMRSSLAAIFQKYTAQGGLTLGVCNGFQVLIQLGAFTGVDHARSVTLATNDHGRFRDLWVEVDITDEAKKSPWFQNMSGALQLPIRHKEGRITVKADDTQTRLHIPLRYRDEVNGSFDRAAALLDETGQILGLMPHPEAATHAFLNPLAVSDEQKEQNAQAVKTLFQNAIHYWQTKTSGKKSS